MSMSNPGLHLTETWFLPYGSPKQGGRRMSTNVALPRSALCPSLPPLSSGRSIQEPRVNQTTKRKARRHTLCINGVWTWFGRDERESRLSHNDPMELGHTGKQLSERADDAQKKVSRHWTKGKPKRPVGFDRKKRRDINRRLGLDKGAYMCKAFTFWSRHLPPLKWTTRYLNSDLQLGNFFGHRMKPCLGRALNNCFGLFEHPKLPPPLHFLFLWRLSSVNRTTTSNNPLSSST